MDSVMCFFIVKVVIFTLMFNGILCVNKIGLNKIPMEASWYLAQDTCNTFEQFLMPDFNSHVVQSQILAKMDPGEVVWVNAKHVLVTYPQTQEGAGLKIGYLPETDTLKYYLCYNGSKKRKCNHANCVVPVSWQVAHDECQSNGMALYNISTPRQTKSAMPHLMKAVEFWVDKFPNNTIPNMDSLSDNMQDSCISLIKDTQGHYGYFRSNCSNKHHFFCATAKVDYAPTLKHLPAVLPVLDDKTVALAEETMLPRTYHVVTTETTMRPDDLPSLQDSELPEPASVAQTSGGSLPAIIGSSVGGVALIILIIVLLLYIRRRRQTHNDYLKSLRRYNQRRTGSARDLVTGTIEHPCMGTGAETMEYEVCDDGKFNPHKQDVVDKCNGSLTTRQRSHSNSQQAVSSKSHKLEGAVANTPAAVATVKYSAVATAKYSAVAVEKSRSDGIPVCRNNLAMYDKMDGPTAHRVMTKMNYNGYVNKRAATGLQDLTCYETFDPDVQQFEKMTNMRTPNQAVNQNIVPKISQSPSSALKRNESTRSLKKPALPLKPKKVKHHVDLDVKLGCKIGQKQIVTNSNKNVKQLIDLDQYENHDLPVYKTPNVTQEQHLDDLDQYENHDNINLGNVSPDKKVGRLEELDQYENFTYTSCTKLKPDDQTGSGEQHNDANKYLDDLDQYENYEGLTKETKSDVNDLNDLDAYENSCFT